MIAGLGPEQDIAAVDRHWAGLGEDLSQKTQLSPPQPGPRGHTLAFVGGGRSRRVQHAEKGDLLAIGPQLNGHFIGQETAERVTTKKVGAAGLDLENVFDERRCHVLDQVRGLNPGIASGILDGKDGTVTGQRLAQLENRKGKTAGAMNENRAASTRRQASGSQAR